MRTTSLIGKLLMMIWAIGILSPSLSHALVEWNTYEESDLENFADPRDYYDNDREYCENNYCGEYGDEPYIYFQPEYESPPYQDDRVVEEYETPSIEVNYEEEY